MKSKTILLTLSLLVPALAFADGGCTPATINASAIQSMHPYMSAAEVLALLGCKPAMVAPAPYLYPPFVSLAQSPGATGYLFYAGPIGNLGAIEVAIDDTHGLIGATYLAPGGIYAVAGMTLINPIRWQINKVSVAP